jgi:hypothetical protein
MSTSDGVEASQCTLFSLPFVYSPHFCNANDSERGANRDFLSALEHIFDPQGDCSLDMACSYLSDALLQFGKFPRRAATSQVMPDSSDYNISLRLLLEIVPAQYWPDSRFCACPNPWCHATLPMLYQEAGHLRDHPGLNGDHGFLSIMACHVAGFLGLRLRIDGVTGHKCPIIDCMIPLKSYHLVHGHVLKEHDPLAQKLFSKVGPFWGSILYYYRTTGDWPHASQYLEAPEGSSATITLFPLSEEEAIRYWHMGAERRLFDGFGASRLKGPFEKAIQEYQYACFHREIRREPQKPVSPEESARLEAKVDFMERKLNERQEKREAHLSQSRRVDIIKSKRETSEERRCHETQGDQADEGDTKETNCPEDKADHIEDSELIIRSDSFAAQVDLSHVSPLFVFDARCQSVLQNHFGHFPLVIQHAWKNAENLSLFARAFALTLLFIMDNSQLAFPPFSWHSFIGDLFQLPYGVTFAHAIAGLIKCVSFSYLPSLLQTRFAEIFDIIGRLEVLILTQNRPRAQLQIERPPSIDIEPNMSHSFPAPRSDVHASQRRDVIDRLKLGMASLSQMNQRMKTTVKSLELWVGRLHKSSKTAPVVAVQSIDAATNCPLLDALRRAGTRSRRGTPVDELVLQIAFVLHTYSYTGYEFLRRYLPLPSRTTIDDHFIQKIKIQEQHLKNSAFIAEIVKGRCHVQYVTLAVDACATDSVFISNKVIPQDEPSYAFTIEVLPLSPREKCFPISVMPSTTGHAGRGQIGLLQAIVGVLGKQEPPVHVLFIATDGDSGYGAEYEAQFNKWFPVYRNFGLGACLNILEGVLPLYVADFLHLVKNVRTRFIKYAMAMRWKDGYIMFWWRRMKNVINLGPVFSDDSSTGKMRDAYPIALFRLEHVIELFEMKCAAEALYLLPWAIVFRVFLSTRLSRETRVSLLQLALAFLIFFHDDAMTAKNPIPEQGRYGKGQCPADRDPQIQECVRPFLTTTLRRCMSTVIGVIYAILKNPEDLPLDRIGTHPLENFFGLLRRILHDCNKFDELVHAAARTIVVDEAFEELRHPRNICGRKNVGGVVSKISDVGASNIPCNPNVIFAAIQDLVQISLTETPETVNAAPGMLWLRAFHQGSVTDAIEKDRNIVIRGTSSSHIMAGLLKTVPCQPQGDDV